MPVLRRCGTEPDLTDRQVAGAYGRSAQRAEARPCGCRTRPEPPVPSRIVTEPTALSDAEWAAMRRRGRMRSYPPGGVLFREGDSSRDVYAIAGGHVKVLLLTPSGRELLLSAKSAGELVGELAAIDGRPRSASAVALDAVDALVVSPDAFSEVLDEHPRLARRLLRVLATHVRDADWRAADRESGDMTRRVARRVVLLAESFGEHSGGGVRIALRLTQEDLAAWVGATREATSRALARLRAAGVVTTGRMRLQVLDLDRLRELAR
jgi:CRP/FNR family cyclic AMP-dependent transcriptional regulator